MRYFVCEHSLLEKDIGRGGVPQVEGLYDYTVEDPRYIFNAFRDYREVHGNVLIPKARIRKKSTKITDLLSGWSCGLSGKLLISDKLKNILANSKQVGFQFFPTTVYDFTGQHTYPYWLVNVYVFFPEYINYAASAIAVASMDGKNKEHVFVNSYDEFCEKVNLYALRDFQITALALLNDEIDYDFFALDRMPGVVWYIVSERLKNVMEMACCTGIVFTEI